MVAVEGTFNQPHIDKSGKSTVTGGAALVGNPDEYKPEYEEFVSFPAAQLDYQVTQDLVKMLTDIRFRLLTILPPIAAASVALVSSQTVGLSPFSMFAVGLLGFFLTLGIILYDLRNSDLYNACVHRAKILEGVMRFVRSGKEGIKPTTPLEESALLRAVAALGKAMQYRAIPAPADRTFPPVAWPGGAHTQRARRYLKFLGFEVAHGSALALVYGTLMGAWIFPIAKGFLVLAGSCLWRSKLTNLPDGLLTSLLAFLPAAVGAYVFLRSFAAMDIGSTVNGLYNDVWREAAAEKRDNAWDKTAKQHAAKIVQASAIGRFSSAVTVSTNPGIRLRGRLRLWARRGKRKRVLGKLAAWSASHFGSDRTKKDLERGKLLRAKWEAKGRSV